MEESEQRLDLMAALDVSAALFEKGSGVLVGVAESRVARNNRAEPQVRDHRRSGVTNE